MLKPKTISIVVAVLALTLLATPRPLYAADGAALKNGVKIYDKPNRRSQVIKRLRKGQKVRVGQKSRKGWYRALIVSGGRKKVGYVVKTEIEVKGARTLRLTKREKKRNRDKKETEVQADQGIKFFVGGFADFSFIGAKELEEKLALPDAGLTKVATGYGGELGVFFSESLSLALRFQTLSLKEVYEVPLTTSTSVTANYNLSAPLLSLLLEYYFVGGDEAGPGLKMGVGLGGGIILSPTLSHENPPSTFPGNGDFGTPIAAVARIAMHYYFVESFGLGFGGGYRYVAENGSGDGGKLTTIGLSAIPMEIGFRLRF